MVFSLKDEHVSNSIAHTIQSIRENIRQVALRVGRDPASIRLVAATKKVPVANLEEAYRAGVRIFGENRLQEAQEKRQILGPREELVWHFIGRMQRRKLKDLVGNFALLHSVESLEQARSINAVAEKLGIQQAVLLEVNVGEEASKGGFTSQEVEAGIEELDRLPHVFIQGLMTLPPWKENPGDVRPYFSEVRLLRDRLARQTWTRIRMNELSMGMSHDYEIAIEEGATMVRIGTAIFGARQEAVSPTVLG
ncbi:MAG TPA: YggS family pyridoxal phosphate-dependent enzyme [Nitrospirales bacterium]|nr:YggS family pyridoxal phosphate-dependent enzyme [Nitrospiraceae bacterium]HNP31269.1 YggS family pyridoxal phosphate-dependent enzyme [Nitrospirales bacterium]